MNLEEETRKYKWEFLRRNKDYISDYLKYKDNKVPFEIIQKWHSAVMSKPRHFWGSDLADPNISNPDLVDLLTVWDLNVFADFLDRRGDAVSLLPPGSEVMGKKVDHWMMHGKKRVAPEELDHGNCPVFISMRIRVLPHYQSTKTVKFVMQEFKKQLALLLKAQRSIYGTKSSRPHFSVYDEYLEVYDLHVTKKWTFKKIARKYFPRDFRAPENEKSRDPEPENAIRNVRYSYQEAKRMIEDGWRYL